MLGGPRFVLNEGRVLMLAGEFEGLKPEDEAGLEPLKLEADEAEYVGSELEPPLKLLELLKEFEPPLKLLELLKEFEPPLKLFEGEP